MSNISSVIKEALRDGEIRRRIKEIVKTRSLLPYEKRLEYLKDLRKELEDLISEYGKRHNIWARDTDTGILFNVWNGEPWDPAGGDPGEEASTLYASFMLDLSDFDHDIRLLSRIIKPISSKYPVRPEDPPFLSIYDEEDLTSIFYDLISGGYFPAGSDLETWLYIFGLRDQPGELLKWTRRSTDPVKGYIFKKVSVDPSGKKRISLRWGRVSHATNKPTKTYSAGKTKSDYSNCGGEIDILRDLFSKYPIN